MSFFPFKNQTSPASDPDAPLGVMSVEMVPERFEEEAPSASRRLNPKALVILAALIVLTVILAIILAIVQNERLRQLALEEAKQAAEDGKIDLALVSLDHYLVTWPDDIPGLELAAKLRTETARDLGEIRSAADAQDRLLRIDPMGPERQENRRHLVELYIRWSDWLRRGSARLNLSLDKTQNRSRAAVKVAEQMLSFGADDADAHRLMGMALESLAETGDVKALVEASVEYEKALRRNPGDVASAERLAKIVYNRGNDPTASDEILDELLRAKPNAVDVRLARYRFLSTTGRFAKAREELEKAIELAPTSLEVRLIAASEALQRRDSALASRHLQAIASSSLSDQRVRTLRGLIELCKENPDIAVESWRKGLMESSGSDRDLTWRLAFTLVQLGRFSEAEPLISQYRRLTSPDDPMLHLLQGIRYEMTGHPSAAIAEMAKLRTSVDKPWHSDIDMALGRCYEQINDEAKAIVEYRQATKDSPRLVQAWRSLARLLNKSNPDNAAREIEAALVLLPDYPELLLDLAMIRLDEQLTKPAADRNWSKLNEVIERANATGRPDPGLVKVQAEVLSTTGRFDESLSLLEQTLRGPARVRGDLWVSWANGLASRGRLDEADKVLERGMAAENAGDDSSLRIVRANLLLKLGKGRAARDLISRGVESLTLPQKIALAQARIRIFRQLGENVEARQACLELARLAPLEPDAGLALLDLSNENGDAEAAKLGLEHLKSVGGDEEPYGLAARALDLLLSNRLMDETRTLRLEKAGELSQKLSALAPMLPVSRLVRGIVLERNHRITEAIVEYRAALEGKTADMALDRLTVLYSRLKRFDDLAALKEKIKSPLKIDQVAARLAIDQGDKDEAERVVSRFVEGQTDTVQARAAQAAFLRELGKPEAAEETLREMVQRDKDRGDAWVALVLFQASQGNTAEAARTIERASEFYKGERPDLLIARLRFIAGDRDTAARLYDDALAHNPEDLPTYQAASEFAEAIGKFDRAEAIARKALNVRSCAPWAARTLAVLLARRPNPNAWNEAWKLVSPGGPGAGDSPADRFLQASLLAQSTDPNRRAESTAVLTALIDDLAASHPIAIRARVNLATSLLQAGKAAEAAKLIEPATEETVPADPPTLALAVEVLARAGKPDQAEQRFSRLAALDPNSAQFASSRAWLFLARGKPEEAVVTIEDAAAALEKTADGDARNVLGFKQLVTMNQPVAAERLGRKIAKLWPKQAWVLGEFLATKARLDEALDAARIAADAGASREPLMLALSLVINGRLNPAQAEKARAIADTITTAHPNDIDLMVLSCALANRQGRFDDSLRSCRRAFEANPTNPICQTNLNDMALILCEELNRPAEALVEVDRLLKLTGSTLAMDTRGVILTRLGRYDQAIEQLERCVKKEPAGSGNRLLHLARAYQKAGQVEQYRGSLDRAKKAGINLAALSPKERDEFADVIAHR